MAARTVQRHDQFRAVKHCMLKILVERDGIVRAGIHTELAEHARTEVVLVLSQYLLFLVLTGGAGAVLVTPQQLTDLYTKKENEQGR